MKVAIVDDEADMRASISQWLALSGFDTETYPSAEDALKSIGADFSGDAFAPELDNTWQPLHTSPQHTSSTGLPHRFVTYGRKAQPGGAT